ncbi:MAG: DegT/DnrJ/EryC1/StrS family aminotransferase [Coxiellaceae bacterium]|jgi:UDP-2-acetamido-2-deoxy-ribo-hexuluronate aminotransferase|nr:DegT/DnrJ/EryC1/StrS family aminotransferase [Coxiellaceae bacterium]
MLFVDLNRQYKKIRSGIHRRIRQVLNHGSYIMGPEIKELEDRLTNLIGVKHCIAVSSGTDALLIAMMALGIGKGDEIITTPFTFISTAETIAILGAIPVFVDIDSRTYNIDPAKIESAITIKTKAIMAVSIFGQCADYDLINAIAKKYKILVIEDGAQSFGAIYKGRNSCNLTTIGCTSFFPSKPLGCYGDGGACFTNDDYLAKCMREIMTHGQDKRYHHVRLGVNGRMDTMQAAILLVKLEIFSNEIKLRQKIGARYTELLKDSVITPHIECFNTSVYAQYTIQLSHRNNIMEKLKQVGIPTAVHYPIPLHKQPIFSCYNDYNFPIAEAVSNKVLSLPMYPYLMKQEIDFIANEVITNSKKGEVL